MVALAHQRAQRGDQRIAVGHRTRLAADGGDHLAGVPGQLGPVQEHHRIGAIQRRRQRLRMRAQPHRIAARLHRHHDARRADLRTQALERGGDGRGVMGEIVVHGDAARLADHLQPALDAAERGQGRHHAGDVHTHGVGGGQRRQAVEHVVPADQRPMHLAHFHPMPQHGEGAAVGLDQARAPVQRSIEAEAFHGVQQPIASTSSRCASAPLTISRPLPGTVRTR